MKVLKNVAKSIIRRTVEFRLRHFPLSRKTAEWYADQFKRWPAVFTGLNHHQRCDLPAGMTMDLGVVDVIERSLLIDGRWDPIIERTIRACLTPGDTFLDVGANIGYFSLMASQIVGPSGQVVSFEPSIRALSRLTHHLQLNQCSNVRVCSAAMGETSGTAQLNWASSSNIGGSSINRGTASQGQTEQIAVRRLDDVCQEMDLAPAMIKLDVEGFELFALRGARETLSNHHPIVVCELTSDFLEDHGQSGTELLQFMYQLGYRAWLIELDSSGQLVVEECESGQAPGAQTEVVFAMQPPPMVTRASTESSMAKSGS